MRYFLEKSAHSPKILFEKGILLIAGRSIPEDSFGLYEPLLKFLEQYATDFPKIEVNVKLEYANSSTNRSLMSLFEMMLEHIANGYKAEVIWFYVHNDKEMLDLGTDFKELLPLPFELRAVDSLEV